jgi:hypothetical protein
LLHAVKLVASAIEPRPIRIGFVNLVIRPDYPKRVLDNGEKSAGRLDSQQVSSAKAEILVDKGLQRGSSGCVFLSGHTGAPGIQFQMIRKGLTVTCRAFKRFRRV